MTPTIDVGRWKCGCGGWLDLSGRPSPDGIDCRCRSCHRRYRVKVIVREVVEDWREFWTPLDELVMEQ